MKTAVLYTRVSTDEQAVGYSLGTQQEKLIEHCRLHGIEVLQIYVEDYSAKNFKRPEFSKFLQYAKANHRNIDYLLFMSWDRFSRNLPDAYEMLARLKKWDIEAQAIMQPLDLTIPQNKVMLAIYLILPEVDNDIHSQRITSGVRGARKAGRWTSLAPVGYKNQRDEADKPIIVFNEHAPDIEWSFREAAKGLRPLNNIVSDLSSRGIKISRSNFSRLLRSPVYMGKIFLKATNDEPEQLVDGLHEGIISEELFYEVQLMLARKNKNTKTKISFRDRDEIPLRGLLLCAKCGKHITGSASRSQNGDRHYYYHCMNCKQERFKAEKANAEMDKLLGILQIPQEIKMLFSEIVDIQKKGNSQQKGQQLATLSRDLNKQQARREQLQNVFLDGRLSPEDYAELKEKIDNQIAMVSNQMAEKKKRNITREPDQLITDLAKWYRERNVQGKKQLLALIFPAKVIYRNDTLQVNSVSPGINAILSPAFDYAAKTKYAAQLQKLLKKGNQSISNKA